MKRTIIKLTVDWEETVIDEDQRLEDEGDLLDYIETTVNSNAKYDGFNICIVDAETT